MADVSDSTAEAAETEPKHLEVTIPVTTEDINAIGKVVAEPEEVWRIAEIAVRAGAMELLALATGRAVFSSMSDLRQFRVYCLLLSGLQQGEAIQVVEDLFQIEPVVAKNLVNKTLARYRVELREGWFPTLGDLMVGAKWQDNRWVFSPSAFLAERLKELVQELGVILPTTIQGNEVAMDDASYEKIVLRLGRVPKPKK